MPEANFVFPNDPHVAWSIMIVLYPYVTGLVAGAFVVSALYHVFRQEVFKPVARLALVTSLCFCAFATMPLLLHLHHPERALNIVFTPNLNSAMAGFGFIYSLYMLVLVVELWLVYRPLIVERANSKSGFQGFIYRVLTLGVREISERAKVIDDWMIRALTFIGIPIACVLHGYVGFLFGGIKANPWWSTSLMPVIFLVSAIVSGIAVLIVLYLFISWRRGQQADANCVRALSRYLWGFLVLALSLEMLEVIHMGYESDEEWKVINALLFDRLSVSYGIIQVMIGSLIPLVLLPLTFWSKMNTKLLGCLSSLCALLVLVQVFAMRWNVVVGGQLFSKSFRGFVEFPMHWGGREGLAAAIVIMLLPLVALWVATKLLPIFPNDEAPAA